MGPCAGSYEYHDAVRRRARRQELGWPAAPAPPHLACMLPAPLLALHRRLLNAAATPRRPPQIGPQHAHAAVVHLIAATCRAAPPELRAAMAMAPVANNLSSFERLMRCLRYFPRARCYDNPEYRHPPAAYEAAREAERLLSRAVRDIHGEGALAALEAW